MRKCMRNTYDMKIKHNLNLHMKNMKSTTGVIHTSLANYQIITRLPYTQSKYIYIMFVYTLLLAIYPNLY